MPVGAGKLLLNQAWAWVHWKAAASFWILPSANQLLGYPSPPLSGVTGFQPEMQKENDLRN